jgi:hypothetical protein
MTRMDLCRFINGTSDVVWCWILDWIPGNIWQRFKRVCYRKIVSEAQLGQSWADVRSHADIWSGDRIWMQVDTGQAHMQVWLWGHYKTNVAYSVDNSSLFMRWPSWVSRDSLYAIVCTRAVVCHFPPRMSGRRMELRGRYSLPEQLAELNLPSACFESN